MEELDRMKVFNLCHRIAEHYGEAAQIEKLHEESTELTKAVINYQNAQGDTEKYNALMALASEVGDVFVVATGLGKIIPGFDYMRDGDMINKTEREIRRINDDQVKYLTSVMEEGRHGNSEKKVHL